MYAFPDDLPRMTCPATAKRRDGRYHAQVVSRPTFAPWTPHVVLAVSLESFAPENEDTCLDAARELLSEIDRQ